ncbi:MAG: hypothetical protein ACE5KH_06200, partial [Candidatus Geothermarchaeales archaeon]
MPSNRTTFGKAIRRSGIPLEYAVSKLLEDLNVLPKGKYFYEVDSETRETDLWGLKGWVSGPNEVQHVWFMECKQREGEKTWCFFPPAANVLDLSRNAFLIETLIAGDDLNPGRLRGLLNPILPELPVVGEGVEAYRNAQGSWTTNNQAVTNATRQAIMPIGHHMPFVLERNFVLDYEGQQLALYLPIVVTTAKLYRLEESCGWKDLSSFDEIEECFVREPALLSSFTTPTYVSRYWTETIRSYMIQIEQRYPDV